MDDLIARLEKATGPDRALDEAIERAIGTYSAFSYYKLGDNDQPDYIPIRYTASIDAALTLVPDYCEWEVISDGWAKVFPDEQPPHPTYEGQATGVYRPYCSAIALCIASLRARKIAAVRALPPIQSEGAGR